MTKPEIKQVILGKLKAEGVEVTDTERAVEVLSRCVCSNMIIHFYFKEIVK